MATAISKRQQARNERALQELIRTVPGNDRCADCQARNPGWASWSLGIFLCLRCAALHRKLGTHISKVKSLNMDTWASDQVETMKVTGNIASNRVFNPRNVRPTIPPDPDEVDTAMEKFIRAKYQRRTLGADNAREASRHNTGSNSSTDDNPPPVPEKNTPRLASALRSASSTYPISPNERPLPAIKESNRIERPQLDTSGRQTSEDKLATLRGMGFTNEKRNTTLLRGLNGSVERTAEALVRLGEGNDATRTAVATGTNFPTVHPVRSDSLPSPRNESTSGGTIEQVNNYRGITGQNNTGLPAKASYNPFDAPTAQPLTQASAQPVLSVDSAFQSLSISQQPLFPNNTGTVQAQIQHNPFLKTYTPPITPNSYQNNNSYFEGGNSHNIIPQRGFTDPTTSTNPFLRPSRSQTFAPSNLSSQPPFMPQYSNVPQNIHSAPPVPNLSPWADGQRSASQPQLAQNPQYSMFGHVPSPFAQHGDLSRSQPLFQAPFQQSLFSEPQLNQNVFSESPIASPAVQDSPVHTGQQGVAGMLLQQQSQPYPPSSNYFSTQQHQQQHQQQQPHGPFQSQTYQGSNGHTPLQSQTPYQQPAKPLFDKSSILALYNQPNINAPTTQPLAQSTWMQSSPGPNSTSPQPSPTVGQPSNQNNPFAGLVINNSVSGPLSHTREESKDFTALMRQSNGRHSPDAFAGLSARYR